VFMALAVEGVAGLREMIDRQMAIAGLLRRALAAEDWSIRNDTRLPLVCFVPSGVDEASQDGVVRTIEQRVAASGNAWVSSVALRGRLVLRACITSFETTPDDVDVLLATLGAARNAARQATPD